MGFLRQSNLALKSVKTFDLTRQVTRGDVALRPDGVLLKLKWSKIRQTSATNTSIFMPKTRDPKTLPLYGVQGPPPRVANCASLATAITVRRRESNDNKIFNLAMEEVAYRSRV